MRGGGEGTLAGLDVERKRKGARKGGGREQRRRVVEAEVAGEEEKVALVTAAIIMEAGRAEGGIRLIRPPGAADEGGYENGFGYRIWFG